MPRFAMRNPLELIPSARRPPIFWLLFGFTILLLVVFGITGAPLTTEAAPYGVASFELAGTVEQMQKILTSWDLDAQIRAAFGLGLDYLFMVAYAGTLAIGCGIAADALAQKHWPLAGVGYRLAWGIILAALLDVVENIALVNILFGAISSPWPQIARYCAILKFVLIFLGIVYVIYGGVVVFVERIAPKESER